MAAWPRELSAFLLDISKTFQSNLIQHQDKFEFPYSYIRNIIASTKIENCNCRKEKTLEILQLGSAVGEVGNWQMVWTQLTHQLVQWEQAIAIGNSNSNRILYFYAKYRPSWFMIMEYSFFFYHWCLTFI